MNHDDNIKAILFLATPHRGANFAALLSTVLSISFSCKNFVGELQAPSPIIATINDYFPERAFSLELISFSASTGVLGMGVIYFDRPMLMVQVIINEKSAIIGFVGEQQAVPLHGNHLEICKFNSVEDPNLSGHIARICKRLVRSIVVK
jgi:hypothetical protein